jgi:hypothetical protein
MCLFPAKGQVRKEITHELSFDGGLIPTMKTWQYTPKMKMRHFHPDKS